MKNLTPIIIVDDHKITRDGIRAMLIGNKSFVLVADVGSGAELFETLDKQVPEIVILDIGLTEINGIEITKELNQKHPQIKVLILSANTDEENIVSAIKAGAKGFLSKECSQGELIKALTCVSHGEEYYGESISSIIYNSYLSSIKKNNVNKPELTAREIEILKAFSEGLCFKEIADKLCISARTVESHKNNILQKLDLKNTIEMVKYAIKKGFIEL
ncbi:DNA-binding NarL/FixJ family response regulator [Natronoflexus pectinivorans]|uniref:DNA-binding NarL/FixJ family response regulator n=2 Tax=Natronoflexus pectinivorans TaxID=682526 RepID=A0A4R2GPP3_9BACT|nr:DNA-binding NarL/FixJ family response regulator [Natronoflexus pectinivorans]